MHNTFGTKHIILLIISIVIIVLAAFLSKKIKLKTFLKILLYVGIVSETIKIAYYTIQNEGVYGGYLPKSDLPFHLCSIQILFIIILNVSKNEKLNRILLAFMLPSCLIGGAAALLLPTYTARNGMWILTFQYFMYHIALITFGIYLFIQKEVKWTIKDYFNTLKFILFIGFFAIYINSICYDAVKYINESGEVVTELINRPNFMYVIDPPQSGLPFLNKNNGWGVYIIHYAFLCLFAISICYIKPIINQLKKIVKNEVI